MPPKAKTPKRKASSRLGNVRKDPVIGLRPRYEKFAQGIANGLCAAESYRQNVAKAQITMKSAWEAASCLLKNPKVSSRIKELERDMHTILRDELHYTQRQHARTLVEMITTPVGELDEMSPHAVKVKRRRRVVGKGEDAEEWEEVEIEGPNKIAAGDQLAKMAGFYPKDAAEAQAAGASAEVLEALKALFDGE